MELTVTQIVHITHGATDAAACEPYLQYDVISLEAEGIPIREYTSTTKKCWARHISCFCNWSGEIGQVSQAHSITVN